MKTRFRTRILSLFLTAVLCMSLLPGSALSATATAAPELTAVPTAAMQTLSAIAVPEPASAPAPEAHLTTDDVGEKSITDPYIPAANDTVTWVDGTQKFTVTYDGNIDGTLTKGSGLIGEVVIPSGKSIKTINTATTSGSSNTNGFGGSGAARANPYITKITIPASVESINAGSFQYCQTLTEAVFEAESSLASLGNNVFSQCAALERITLPASVKSLGNNVFQSCTTLAGEIFSPGSTLTTLGNYVFYGCTSLLSITIPASVTSLGTHVFNACTGLTAVAFEEGIALDVLSDNTFAGCTSLGGITIPASVTKLGDYAFYNCSALTSVSFGTPTILTSMGNYTFYGCTGLGSITIPASVETLDSYVFQGCSALTSVTFEAGTALTSLGYCVFDGCALESIAIPASVKIVGTNAFSNNSRLTTLIIPEGVTTLGSHVAYNSTALETVSLPGSLENVSTTYLFAGCTALTEVTFGDGIGITSFGTNVFSGCTSLKSLQIPAAVTSIDQSCFRGSGLEEIVIPPGVTTIRGNAFNDSKSLKKITLSSPSTDIVGASLVTMIYGVMTGLAPDCEILGYSGTATHKFAVCQENITFVPLDGSEDLSLRKPTANETIDFLIDGRHFYTVSYDAALNGTLTDYVGPGGHLVIPADKNITLVGGTRTGAVNKVCIYTSSNANSTVTGVEVPEGVTEIRQYALSGLSGLKTIKLPSTLKVLGSAFINTGSANTNVGPEEILLPEGLTTIADSAFANLGALKSISIPSTVQSIGAQTFSGCISLKSISFPPNFKISTLGENMFSSCSSLQSITIPASVELIDRAAFRSCAALTSILFEEGSRLTAIGDTAFQQCGFTTTPDFPPTLRTLGNYVFSQMPTLDNLIIPEGVTTIGNYLASNSGQIASVSLPSTLTSIGTNSFSSCGSLTTVKFADGIKITGLSGNMFNGCTALKKFTIPSFVTSIGERCFYNTGLTKIDIPESITSIGAGAFYYNAGLKNVIIRNDSVSIAADAFAYVTCTMYGNEGSSAQVFAADKPDITFALIADYADAVVLDQLKINPDQPFDTKSTIAGKSFNAGSMTAAGDSAAISFRSDITDYDYYVNTGTQYATFNLWLEENDLTAKTSLRYTIGDGAEVTVGAPLSGGIWKNLRIDLTGEITPVQFNIYNTADPDADADADALIYTVNIIRAPLTPWTETNGLIYAAEGRYVENDKSKNTVLSGTSALIYKNHQEFVYIDLTVCEGADVNFAETGTKTNDAHKITKLSSVTTTPGGRVFDRYALEYALAANAGEAQPALPAATVTLNGASRNAGPYSVTYRSVLDGVYTPDKIIVGSPSVLVAIGSWNHYSRLGPGIVGNYQIYKYDDPIHNDPTNPYGVDFVITGNRGTGMEPGNVAVSQDGITWYNIAGQQHYERTNKYEFVQNSRGEFLDAILTYRGSGYPPANDFKWGYVDVAACADGAGTEGTGLVTGMPRNPYLENGHLQALDVMDISWAVDGDGKPVSLDHISYIRIQNAIDSPAFAGLDTEIGTIVRTDNYKSESALAVTEAPDVLTVAGVNLLGETAAATTFLHGEPLTGYYELDVSDKNLGAAVVTVEAQNPGTHIYINKARYDDAGTYTGLFADETSLGLYNEPGELLIRILVQRDNLQPRIYVVKVMGGDPEAASVNTDILSVEIFPGDTVLSAGEGALDGGFVAEVSDIVKSLSFRVTARNLGAAIAITSGDGIENVSWTALEQEVESEQFFAVTKGENRFTLRVTATDGKTEKTYPVLITSKEITQTITVSFKLSGDVLHYDMDREEYTDVAHQAVVWIDPVEAEVPAGWTVKNLTDMILKNRGIAYRTNSDGTYIEKIQEPGGTYVLGQFDNGPNSGWMYRQNGIIANTGYAERVLANADIIAWFYTDDYTKESDYEENADKTALLAAIRSVEDLDSAKYTDESWSAVQTTLAAATTAAEDPWSLQSEVDAAAQALVSTISALVLKQTGTPDEPVNVDLWVQIVGDGFYMVDTPATVAPNLSERYGYQDEYNGLKTTSLDALVSAHITLFGDEDLDDYLTVNSTGSITKAFGVATYNFLHMINGEAPGDRDYVHVYSGMPGKSEVGYAVTQSLLTDGDDITFLLLDNGMWYGMDYISWFGADDTRVDTLALLVDEPVELALYGHTAYYVNVDPETRATWTDPIEDALVTTVELTDGGAFTIGTFDDPELGVTDEDGIVELCFDTPGTYILTALADPEDPYAIPLVSPWLVVTVTDPTVVIPVDKTALNAAITAAEAMIATLNEADYTADSWSALQAALNAAKTIFGDVDATEDEVLSGTTVLQTAANALELLPVEQPVSYDEARIAALAWISANVPNPTFDSIGGEWSVLALARGGITDTAWFDTYRSNLEAAILTDLADEWGDMRVDGDQLILHTRKYTDNSRVIIALASLGIDARQLAVGSDTFDLVSVLANKQGNGEYQAAWQGVNGSMWALLALNTNKAYLTDTALRGDFIDLILDGQQSAGYWTMGLTDAASNSPVDMTGMAIQALAPYYGKDAAVTEAVDRALTWLSDRQNAVTGRFDFSAEAAAQVVVALTAMNIDPTTDPRFTKNGVNPLDALLTYYNAASGAFRHTDEGGDDKMATDQAAYALVSYYRLTHTMTALYDMSDVFGDDGDDGGDVIDPPVPPIVNKSALNSAIAGALSLQETDYTTASWIPLQEALELAQAVSADTNATQEAVDAATSALHTALLGLVPVDPLAAVNKAVLNGTITEAASLASSSTRFTAVSWQAVAAALTTAQAVAANPSATQAEIDSAAAALRAALDNLVLAPTGGNGNGSGTGGGGNGSTTGTTTPTPATASAEDQPPETTTLEDDETPYGAVSFGRFALMSLPATEGKLPYYRDADGIRHFVGFSIYRDGTVYFLGDPDQDYAVAKNPKNFSDIAEHWAFEPVQFVAEREIFLGVGENTFAPEDFVTRAMLVTILGRMNMVDTAKFSDTPFSDVAADTWYTPYVGWAAENGIVLGYEDGSFQPDRNISRQELAVVICRFLDYMELTLPTDAEAAAFNDQDLIASWAAESVARLQRCGILNGKGANNFDPEGTTLRGELAAVLQRTVAAVLDELITTR